MQTLVKFVAVGLVISVAGCGGGEKADPSHKTTGTVSLDGKPVAKGSIIFEADGNVGSADIVDGKYEVLLQAGKYKVQIRASKEVGEKDETGEAPTVETIPAKYNDQTELEKEVKEGGGTIDFDLKSK